MDYSIQAQSTSKNSASVSIKQADINFGITPETNDELPNPAELFLGSFASCILKNVERFSIMMHFQYSQAKINVKATRLKKPPRIDSIQYELTIYCQDSQLNIDLLRRNIENYGTIFNTVKISCKIEGEIKLVNE